MIDPDEQKGIEEIDRLFREADFAAENEGLEKQLRALIRERLAGTKATSSGAAGEILEERELDDEELSGLAAAGTGEELKKALYELLRIFR